MDKEKSLDALGLGWFCLVLVGWGQEIFDVWPVLVAHVTPTRSLIFALVNAGVLLYLIALYAKAPKGTARREILLAATFMIISWTANLNLMVKIGGH